MRPEASHLEKKEEIHYCTNCPGVKAVEFYEDANQYLCQKCLDHYFYMDYLSSRNE